MGCEVMAPPALPVSVEITTLRLESQQLRQQAENAFGCFRAVFGTQ